MKVYKYHGETGEFRAEQNARPDPMVPGRFVIPARCTEIAPPETGPDQVAVFDVVAGAWTVQPDHRGRVYWTAGGDRVEVKEIGEEIPADALDAPPAPPPPPDYLTAPQFEFLLALTGFGDVWDALADRALKTGDRGLFAALKAERSRSRFILDNVLAVADRFQDAAAQVAPDVDLSESAIRAAWKQAKEYRGLS